MAGKQAVQPETWEQYPLRVVLTANGVSLAVELLGLALTAWLSPWLAVLYGGLIATLELRVLATHCVDCYYYGKTCFCGKGRLSALFFRRGDPDRFNARVLRWRDLWPDLLLLALPLLAGLWLLARRFHWGQIFLLLAFGLAALPATGWVRRQLACAHCVQRLRGCPAARHFGRA